MVFTENFAHDFGALPGRTVMVQTHLMQAIENAPVYRLQTVTNIRQSAAHDYAHRVIEIRALHLVFDID
jgi:hypothetical protein